MSSISEPIVSAACEVMLKKAFRENDLHRWLETFPQDSRVELGIGHDAAVARSSSRVFLKADQVIEGVHFQKGVSARLAGRKLLHRTLSDAAAVGGTPRFVLCSLAIPRKNWSSRRVREFLEGIRDAGTRWGISLVGGDLARSHTEFVASLALIGDLDRGLRAPGRSGAKPGDQIFVTGKLGGSILGKHLHFRPRCREGALLLRRFAVHAMMDLSDGLAADLPRLCRASGVGAVIEAALVPISAAARRLSRKSKRAALWHALCDGEDYELLVVAPARESARLHRHPWLRQAGLQKIGEIVKGREVRLLDPHGKAISWPRGGYEHVWL